MDDKNDRSWLKTARKTSRKTSRNSNGKATENVDV